VRTYHFLCAYLLLSLFAQTMQCSRLLPAVAQLPNEGTRLDLNVILQNWTAARLQKHTWTLLIDCAQIFLDTTCEIARVSPPRRDDGPAGHERYNNTYSWEWSIMIRCCFWSGGCRTTRERAGDENRRQRLRLRKREKQAKLFSRIVLLLLIKKMAWVKESPAVESSSTCLSRSPVESQL
jgi:hypothetical protein